MEAFAGIDLGGTNTRVALVDQGQVVETLRFATESHKGPEDLVRRLCGALGRLRELAAAKGVSVAGVGLACPGNLDRGAGAVSFSPNLPAMKGFPLVRALGEGCGLPVHLENDANCYALGEHRFGPFRGRDLALFTLGTGVGGGLILGGRLVVGPLGIGGELGHLLVEPGGRPCGCGAAGCLESYASATGMAGMLREGLAAGRRSCLGPADGPEQVAAAAGDGDELAREIMQRAGTALGRAFASVAVFTGCDLILLGGGVSAAWPLLEAPARLALADGLRIADPGSITMAPAGLGADAPLLGAAALAERAHLNRS